MLLGDTVVEVPEGVPVGSGFLGPVCGKGGVVRMVLILCICP